MEDMNTQRKGSRVRKHRGRATIEIPRSTRFTMLLLFAITFLKYFRIARSRHVTQCTVKQAITKSAKQLLAWYGGWL